MEILLVVAFIFGAFAVYIFIADAMDSWPAGVAGTLLYVLILLAGMGLLQEDAEADLASAICYAEVTADPDWQTMPVSALRTAAAAAVPAAHMSVAAADTAADACYEQLQAAALKVD